MNSPSKDAGPNRLSPWIVRWSSRSLTSLIDGDLVQWTDEIGSRVDDILRGKVRTVPRDEVLAKLAADRAERNAAREN